MEITETHTFTIVVNREEMCALYAGMLHPNEQDVSNDDRDLLAGLADQIVQKGWSF